MAIILSHPMTSQEIRVLQEFRRVSVDTLPLTAIKAIKHPVGGGDAPARSLVTKGYLTADAGGESFTLSAMGKEFLVLDPKPMWEEPSAKTASAEPAA